LLLSSLHHYHGEITFQSPAAADSAASSARHTPPRQPPPRCRLSPPPRFAAFADAALRSAADAAASDEARVAVFAAAPPFRSAMPGTLMADFLNRFFAIYCRFATPPYFITSLRYWRLTDAIDTSRFIDFRHTSFSFLDV
jgi:hypothetical protein